MASRIPVHLQCVNLRCSLEKGCVELSNGLPYPLQLPLHARRAGVQDGGGRAGKQPTQVRALPLLQVHERPLQQGPKGVVEQVVLVLESLAQATQSTDHIPVRPGGRGDGRGVGGLCGRWGFSVAEELL
jgi:hypothetical protein